MAGDNSKKATGDFEARQVRELRDRLIRDPMRGYRSERADE